jgi:hypothetical protein
MEEDEREKSSYDAGYRSGTNDAFFCAFMIIVVPLVIWRIFL